MKTLHALSKFQIKIILLFVGFIIVVAAVLYTNFIVDELIKTEQKKIKFYADLYKKQLDPDELQKILENSEGGDDQFAMLIELASTISFPIIITDAEDSASYPYEQWSLNLDLDTSLTINKQRQYVQDYILKMGSSYEPITVKTKDGAVLFKLYYTHTLLLDKLLLFPFIVITIVTIFILVGYLAFSNIRRNQESKVWVGMSKEAAHQLGTPLSSLLAWLEILRYNKDNPESIEETLGEMQSDLDRLNVIATRFSKIGSQPELKVKDIGESLENISKYFEKRLPHLGKKIEIERNLNSSAFANINIELFAWVIENLLKNGAEAIETKEGKLIIDLQVQADKKVVILLKDTGKGLSKKQKRQVFYPGYTTKKRGWGLGLSLCKRIVEEYHRGKIYVKESAHGAGTTFAIELPLKKKGE